MKVLVPIDGTAHGWEGVRAVRAGLDPATTEVMLLTVATPVGALEDAAEVERRRAEGAALLSRAAGELPGFATVSVVAFGQAGENIVAVAAQEDVDAIAIVRATKVPGARLMGSVAAHVVRHADRPVVVLPTSDDPDGPAAGRFAPLEGHAVLQGQFEGAGSSLLLPVRTGRCRYELEVERGRVRVSHASFDPDGGTWLAPPGAGQRARWTIGEGERAVIELEALVRAGHVDRVEAVNPQLRAPASLSYRAVLSDGLGGEVLRLLSVP